MEQDVIVRGHLDVCPRCVNMMTIGHRLENFLKVEEDSLPTDFEKRVLGEFPVAGIGATVTRYLIAVFGASAAFAASAYWLFAQFARGGSEVVAEKLETRPETLNAILTEWVADPTLRYIGLAVLALILCAVLVIVVDTPRRTERAEEA
jgi:hypothetical protein